MHTIPELCQRLNLTPRTLVEVGAHHPYTYRLGHYVQAGNKVILIEASPRMTYCFTHGHPCNGDDTDFINSWPAPPAPPYPHYSPPVTGSAVQIINAAVTDHNGVVTFYNRLASSFVQGVASPARQNDGYVEKAEDGYEVPAIRIDSIDDGQIDVLLADCEGSEWFCLKYLISRPRLIVLEMRGNHYTNPFTREIIEWMKTNGYVVLEMDETDVAFARP